MSFDFFLTYLMACISCLIAVARTSVLCGMKGVRMDIHFLLLILEGKLAIEYHVSCVFLYVAFIILMCASSKNTLSGRLGSSVG